MAKWVEFQLLIPKSSKMITKRWEVQTKVYGPFTLGYVQWFSRWRKYAFFPLGNTVFEEQCLKDIAQFCEEQTKEHRQKTQKYKNKNDNVHEYGLTGQITYQVNSK